MIELQKLVENYVISLLGLSPATREIKFKFTFVLFTSIKFHKLFENYVTSFLGLGPATKKITGTSLRPSKEKKL